MSSSKENTNAVSEVTNATVISDKGSSDLKKDADKQPTSKTTTTMTDTIPQSPHDSTFYQQHHFYNSYQNNVSPHSPPSASLNINKNGGYDNSFLAQHSIGSRIFNQNFSNNIPMSPAGRDIRNGEAHLPPASPLFPGTLPLYSSSSEQLESNLMNGASMFTSNTSPNFPYITAPPPPSPIVSAYGFPPPIPNTPESRTTWGDSMQHQMYNSASSPSPHLHGIPQGQYHGNSRRATSFDGEIMLPPSAIDENSLPTNNNATTGTGTIVHQQSSWAPSPQLYSPQLSAVQQHLTQISSPPRIGGMHGRVQNHQTMSGPYAGYYHANPGPPIQTAQNNKGPDGANLFIFHIPNHFTNLDMWSLFCHYGNLLSVRIMVEKDTGRSRGFGFVSYDSPDAAAMAIKELNGFVIGNKRLKVQHKQIRQSGNSPSQQQTDMVPNTQSFQETNSTSNESGSDWNGDKKFDRIQQSNTNADTTTSPNPDMGDENNDATENVGSPLADLNSMKEALPDVK